MGRAQSGHSCPRPRGEPEPCQPRHYEARRPRGETRLSQQECAIVRHAAPRKRADLVYQTVYQDSACLTGDVRDVADCRQHLELHDDQARVGVGSRPRNRHSCPTRSPPGWPKGWGHPTASLAVGRASVGERNAAGLRRRSPPIRQSDGRGQPVPAPAVSCALRAI